MSMNSTKIRALHIRNESDHNLAENITLSEIQTKRNVRTILSLLYLFMN